MLLKRETLAGIEAGAVSLAFRRWRRPTVKAGGTLLTAIGQLAIHSVDRVELDAITASEAAAAGFQDLASLRRELTRRTRGDVYRVRLSLLGPDPRIALRAEIPDESEMRSILERLRRLDERSSAGPWTRRVLELIRRRPAVRAADLAAVLGTEKAPFKVNVRKLKRLGLTESLDVGYRLSPRGQAVVEHLVAARG